MSQSSPLILSHSVCGFGGYGGGCLPPVTLSYRKHTQGRFHGNVTLSLPLCMIIGAVLTTVLRVTKY